MPEGNFRGYGMMDFPGVGGLMNQFGGPAFGNNYGYDQELGYSPSSSGSRRGHSKRENCPGSDCNDDERSGDSIKNNSESTI